MATLLTFKPESCVDEHDLAAIAALINTCRAADDLESRTTVPRLQEEFADPQFEVDRDLRLWRDQAGELIAMAQLWRALPTANLTAHLYFDVHPHARKSDLAAQIVTWAEQQLRQAGQSLNLPLLLHSGCWDSVVERRNCLEMLGFVPVRYFFELRRSLVEPIPVPTLPAGWLRRTVAPQQEADAWIEMFNQSFIDHWNHHPLTLEDYCHHTSTSTYDAGLDWVIESPKGELASFCFCAIDPERNNRLGRMEGHVCLLGTRRGYRRQGLAKSLLLASLQELRERGMAIASIGVDAQNPSGALGLYQSVGFQRFKSSTVLEKAITP